MHNLLHVSHPDLGDGVHPMARTPGEYVKAGFLLCLIVFVAYLCVLAGQEGISSYEINRTFKEAQDGDVGAQVRLAMLYQIGMFTEQNVEMAVYWFKRAASQGSVMAQEILCWHYGIGCKSDMD